MSLPTIPHDKANHVVYGAAAFAIGHTLAFVSGYAPFALHAGAALTLFVGIGKEVMDVIGNRRAAADGLPAPHSAEGMDAIATIAGGALVAWPVFIS